MPHIFRIALLRTEEQKAMGKINETEARAKEILDIKKRNEVNLAERFSHTLQASSSLFIYTCYIYIYALYIHIYIYTCICRYVTRMNECLSMFFYYK